jgi:predicted lysophospholipase L1 biosynthesis ABC-type transport system permease subunit
MRAFWAAASLARRDLRGGLSGLWAALACLALGVAAAAAGWAGADSVLRAAPARALRATP